MVAVNMPKAKHAVFLDKLGRLECLGICRHDAKLVSGWIESHRYPMLMKRLERILTWDKAAFICVGLLILEKIDADELLVFSAAFRQRSE